MVRLGDQYFFKKIDCPLCPSIWNEPMGRVVIESFSYGYSVIGNNVGGRVNQFEKQVFYLI